MPRKKVTKKPNTKGQVDIYLTKQDARLLDQLLRDVECDDIEHAHRVRDRVIREINEQV